MANIPLSQIPNAPQNVFAPVADPHMSGDVVGDQAKSDIRQGYGASMVDPSRAGALGLGIEQMGQGVMTGAEGVSRGMILSDSADRRAEYQQAANSGLLKFYNNQMEVGKNYQDLMANQPSSMGPVMWDKAVGGKEGANLAKGMSPIEAQTQVHNILHATRSGIAEASNRAFSDQKELETYNYNQQILTQQNIGNFDAAHNLVDAATDSGHFSPVQGAMKHDALDTSKQESQAVIQAKTDPDFRMALEQATTDKTPIPGFPKISPARGVQLANSAVMSNDIDDVKNTQNFLYYVAANPGTTREVLMQNPGFRALKPESQEAVVQDSLNRFAGTPQGEQNLIAARNAVMRFPEFTGPDNKSTLEAASQQYSLLNNVILSKVPNGDEKQDLLKKLHSTFYELYQNGGSLKPDSQVNQAIGQLIGKNLEGGKLFGEYDPDLIFDTSNKTKQADANLNALRQADDIRQKILDSNPKTRSDVQAKFNELTAPLRAAKDDQAQKPQPKSFWQSLSNWAGNFGKSSQSQNPNPSPP